MAYLTMKTGSTGKLSPYWYAVLSFWGSKIWISTKCEKRSQAAEVARLWSRACKLARRMELTGPKADELSKELRETTNNPQVHEQTAKLLKNLIVRTSGEDYGRDFETYVKQWLESRKGTTRPGTFRSYKTALEGLVGSLPQNRRKSSVSSIQRIEICRHRDKLREAGMSQSSLNQRMQIFRTLFNSAIEDGYAVINPVKKADKLRIEVEDKRQHFSDEQVIALLDAAPDMEWIGMILLGYHHGFRIGDARALKWSNVMLEENMIVYQQMKTAHRKKPGERDTKIVMHAEVRKYFERIVPSSDSPHALVFPKLDARHARHRGELSRDFPKIVADAGITQIRGSEKFGIGRQMNLLTYHSLRHSFCSKMAEMGVSPQVAKSISGHSSDAQFEHYVHLSMKAQETVMAQKPGVWRT